MRCDFADARKRRSTGSRRPLSSTAPGSRKTAQAQLADELEVPLVGTAPGLLSRDGADPLGSTGDVSVFCLYKTLPVPNGGLLLVRGNLRSKIGTLPPTRAPRMTSTAIHLGSSMLSNLELRAGPAGRRARELLRNAGRFAIRKASVEFVSTGTQHFDIRDVDLGISSLSHLVLRNQEWAEIVERRRRNYFLLYAMLRDIAPPVIGELRPGVCPLSIRCRSRTRRRPWRAFSLAASRRSISGASAIPRCGGVPGSIGSARRCSSFPCTRTSLPPTRSTWRLACGSCARERSCRQSRRHRAAAGASRRGRDRPSGDRDGMERALRRGAGGERLPRPRVARPLVEAVRPGPRNLLDRGARRRTPGGPLAALSRERARRRGSRLAIAFLGDGRRGATTST